MLTGLSIRDLVLIEALDLQPGAGLTALTGETGAGKSIVLDALGVATGARADSGLVRRGATQAAVSAAFSLPPGHPVWTILEERGLDGDPSEDLVMRRSISADGCDDGSSAMARSKDCDAIRSFTIVELCDTMRTWTSGRPSMNRDTMRGSRANEMLG